MKNINKSNSLPIKNSLRIYYSLSLLIAFLLAIVSIIGILYQNIFYSSDEIIQTFVPNDVVNLTVGLPFLIIAIALTKKHKLIGLLIWPGALFFVIYLYFPYLLVLPFNALYLFYLIIFSFAIYTMIGLIANIDSTTIKDKFVNTVPNKVSGGILIGLAVVIILRQVALMLNTLINNAIVADTELAVWIDDFVIGVPTMLISGWHLWKSKPFGYITGGGLLIAYTLLSLGLIPYLIIQSKLQNSHVDIAGIIILSIMALTCLIPFTYFVRNSK